MSRRQGGRAARASVVRLRRSPFDARGFSLLELSIVVFIVSVLALLAVPVLKRVTLESRAAAVAIAFRQDLI